MMTKTRTAAEAIADILAALYQRMHNAERHYEFAQRTFPVGSPERREAREVLMETKEAYSAVKAIAETVV
jgi:hypothetical protein